MIRIGFEQETRRSPRFASSKRHFVVDKVDFVFCSVRMIRYMCQRRPSKGRRSRSSYACGSRLDLLAVLVTVFVVVVNVRNICLGFGLTIATAGATTLTT